MRIVASLFVLLAPMASPGAGNPKPPTTAVGDSGFGRGATGVSNLVQTDNLSARLIAESGHVVAGATVDLALVFAIRPGWHTYWKNPGDSGEPPRIDWDLPAGVRAGPIRWPVPELIRVGPLANHGYSGRVAHLIELSIPQQWPAGTPLEVDARANWLVCEEACIPEQGRFALSLAVVDADLSARAAPALAARQLPGRAPFFAQARAALPAAGAIAASLERAGDSIRLRVPRAAIAGEPVALHYFAEHWGLIDHAAPQHWELGPEHLVLTLAPGPTSASTDPAGLLRIDSASGTQGLPIEPGAASASAGDAGGSGAAATGADSGRGPGLLLALAFALAGGLVLNLMPCVFPVLAVKGLALAQHGARPVRERMLHAMAYAAGVLTLFAAIAMLLLALRSGGAALGWGFQLQSPIFVVLMAYLFLVLGLSLAGAVTLGAGLMGVAGSTPTHGHLGAFATGALAALVAAPCTAPFMGAAVGYAVVQPWPVALAVLLMLGIGMALPFAALILTPALARYLPRPGRWMEWLKQLLAFPMFATAAWLLWVLSRQVGSSGIGAALAGAVLLALGLWLSEAARAGRGYWRRLAQGSALVALIAVGWLALGVVPNAGLAPGASGAAVSGRADAAASAFSAPRLAAARAAGQPVFVNMTAAWCITCLVNERVALERPAVVNAFAERDVLYLKGDWTNRDANITDYLAEFGRNGVPLYVYYAPGAEPEVLPQLLTESIVLGVLRR
jgi:thiol:disulfide interchange protein DsbD